jgi:bifunctional non-homologous end joining protein LigD
LPSLRNTHRQIPERKRSVPRKVGSGFTDREEREFLSAVSAITQPDCPFESIPTGSGSSWSYGLTATERRTAVWLKPVLSCQVRFTEWTADGHLRHPIFEGWRGK